MHRTAPLAAAAAAATFLSARGFRERVDVDLVRVLILATDAAGRPVRDLRAADFQLKVDGRPVSAEGFEAPRPSEPAGASGATGPEAGLPALPPARARFSGAPDGAVASPGPSYSLAILVDETSSEQSNRAATLEQVFRFLEAPLPPDMAVLLMRFDGTLHIECPWTSDGGWLRRCAAAIARHRYATRLNAPGQARDPGQGTTLLELDAMEAVGHARSSLAAIFDALRVFPDKPGRKALFVVSDGAPFLAPSEIARDLIATSPTANDTALATPRQRMEAAYDRELLLDSLAWDRARTASLLIDVSRLALVRGIEIHPVVSAPHDAGANVRTDRSFAQRATAGAGRSRDRSSLRGDAAAPPTDIAAAGSMEAVAQTTGGRAVLSRRELEDGLRREVAGHDAAYSIAFRDPFPGDHAFHRIEVSSARAGVTLRYRRGYRVLDARESLVQASINHLYVPSAENPLGVRLQMDSLGVVRGRAEAAITVAYPVPPEAGGSAPSAGAVRIIGTCAVRDGRLSEPIDLGGNAERVADGRGTWFVREGRVRLPAGAYRWSFAIRDEQTGITSYVTFERRLP